MQIHTKTTTVRLSDPLYRQIVALSERKQQHVSTLLREAISEFVKNQPERTS